MNFPEDIVKRLDQRPGFSVVDYKEIGLPIFRLNALFTMQEESQIGPIEEFSLRAIRAGVNTVELIVTFLGLPIKIVEKQVGTFLYEGITSGVSGSPGTLQLTAKGLNRLSTAQTSQISRQQLPIYIDGITRQITTVSPQDLYSNGQLEQLSILGIPPSPRRPPKSTEINVANVNRVLHLLGGRDKLERRAIRLDAVLGKSRLYFRRAISIAFKSESGRAVNVAFSIDGRISEEHEIAFAKSGDAERSILFGGIFNADKRRREVQNVLKQGRQDLPNVFDEKNVAEPPSTRPTLTLAGPKRRKETEPKPDHVRTIRVYEHPPLLRSALSDAKQRVLIVSPWIRADVVDKEFIRSLTSCLDRGVDILIAHGLGRVDKRARPQDNESLLALESLAQSFDKMKCIRKKNTHAKVLLVDDRFFVTTSFNWLSFRGDPAQPLREEEGVYVEGKEIVNSYFETLYKRLFS